MQRYLTSKYGYKYFSSPFTNATVSEFGDDMDLASSFPLFYRFDENRTSSGWVAYATGTSPLNPLEGYAANFGATALPWTVDVSGTVNNGNLSVTLYNHGNTYTEGFNLVGNPYPSPIRWSLPGWTKTNIDNAVYYFRASDTDEYGGTYSSYVNGISSDGFASDTIPSMQGFFVHVSNGTFPVTGTLGVTNSVRINDLTSPFLKSAEASDRFLVRMTAAFTDDQASADPLVIYFDNAAEPSFDTELDALKLLNTDMMVPNFYSVLLPDRKLSINGLPFKTDTAFYVPLGLTIYRDGELMFKARDIENIPVEETVYFRDALTGANVDLLRTGEYKLILKQGEYHGRFSLAFVKSTTGIPDGEPADDIFRAYISGEQIRTIVGIVDGDNGMIEVYDMTGRQIFTKMVYEPGQYDLQLDVRPGIYIVRYTTGRLRHNVKLVNGI
jgi:hypothetical protein